MTEFKKKNCFWRHGPYKTIKIIEHDFDGKLAMPNKLEKGSQCRVSEYAASKNYKVKRIFVLQQCQTCGKLLIKASHFKDASRA